MTGAVSAVSIGVAAGLGATAAGLTATTTAAMIGLAAAGIMGGMASTMGGKDINLPDVTLNPAAQAATASRTDTGATVKLGTTVKDQRVSGSKSSGSSLRSSTVDVLGGLGGGGLSV